MVSAPPGKMPGGAVAFLGSWMFISPAYAHVTAGSATPGSGFGPLIFVAAIALFVGFMYIDRKWRERKKNLDDDVN